MKRIALLLISTLIFNTAIAGLLTLLGVAESFWVSFIYSQCIGFSIMSINTPVTYMLHRTALRLAALAILLPLSVAVGMSLAFAIAGGSWNDGMTWITMQIGLFFGLIGTVAVLLSRQVELEASQRQSLQVESEKREMEAQLKMLQAQIEPHFLFNTLANVGGLIDDDPILAKQLMERLNDWLRVALVRARSDNATLGDELEMLENYLQIIKVRFGDRLRWQIEVPEPLCKVNFPPMLLQPLVENAVRHGIEPKLGGGEIRIVAVVESERLRIEVSDTGDGLPDEAGAEGAGLANVRARLATLFGRKGRLSLSSNAGAGVTAILELPA